MDTNKLEEDLDALDFWYHQEFAKQALGHGTLLPSTRHQVGTDPPGESLKALMTDDGFYQFRKDPGCRAPESRFAPSSGPCWVVEARLRPEGEDGVDEYEELERGQTLMHAIEIAIIHDARQRMSALATKLWKTRDVKREAVYHKHGIYA